MKMRATSCHPGTEPVPFGALVTGWETDEGREYASLLGARRMFLLRLQISPVQETK